MNTERWYRIEGLFDQAMALSESERSRFLDEACAGDSELRCELVGLLTGSPTTEIPLRRAVAAEARMLASDVAAGQLGRRIGPFKLIEVVGEGGMGAVYLGERDDAQFEQRVAIKILAHAVCSPAAIARFCDERQILAGLEHPNIVRLLDGGSTIDQLPYLVMEYIEGATITRYADHHQLSVRDRVGLVRRVCTALQYAHQNLVVHRDIKPSNVLVDADGAPKILDFGIAKLLAPVASFERKAKTRPGIAMFTPEYASPEQVRGDAVSTATDVYSVGAVLYELVTGQPPHRASDNVHEAIRVICEVEPPRPSAVCPRARRRELAGDLDNIIARALAKDPAQRYATMEQLSADLGRWLDQLPVTARTPTVGYRAGKFARRNKGLLLATTCVAATLLGATFVSLRQAHRADEQSVRAATAAKKATVAADGARKDAERAKLAEDRAMNQLDELNAERAARMEIVRQLVKALEEAERAKQIAVRKSARARDGEVRAQAAAQAAAQSETATRHEAEVLFETARRIVDDARKPFVNKLSR